MTSIGLGLGLNRIFVPSIGDVIETLYDTGDFVQTNTVTHSDIIDTNAFRGCRTATGYGRLTLSLPNGSYVMGGSSVIAYDGAVSGVTSIDFDVFDTGTRLFRYTTAQAAWEEAITISTGLIRFQTFNSGGGYRVDGFYIRAV